MLASAFHGDVCENYYLNHAQLEYTLGQLNEERGLKYKTGTSLLNLCIIYVVTNRTQK
jgi:hypothetical protein